MITNKKDSPLPTPPPSGSGAPPPPTTTFFCDSNTHALNNGGTILECAEKAGLQLEYGCRQGVCGICKLIKRQGTVEHYDDSTLTDDERKRGYILACVAKADGNIEVEA